MSANVALPGPPPGFTLHAVKGCQNFVFRHVMSAGETCTTLTQEPNVVCGMFTQG